jgi:sigma-E factor negative regulatory protein RseA
MNESRATVAERISALSDGCLTGDEFVQTMTDLHTDPSAVSAWQSYHLIGDVMRDRALRTDASDFMFWEKLEQRLTLEPHWPSIEGEADGVALPGASPAVALPVRGVSDVANASAFHWKMLAGGLSTVLVGALAVVLWSQTPVQPTVQAQAAAARESVAQQFVVKEGEAGVMVRDPQLDEMMAAHRQLGGHSALQVPNVFLRNATFEESAR